MRVFRDNTRGRGLYSCAGLRLTARLSGVARLGCVLAAARLRYEDVRRRDAARPGGVESEHGGVLFAIGARLGRRCDIVLNDWVCS